MQNMGLRQYQPNDWRLFLDSCKRSLKCVLLHNGNKYGSISIARSITMKEESKKIPIPKIVYYTISDESA
jgi:hypothetical protein